MAYDSQGNVIAAGYINTAQDVHQVIIGKYNSTGTSIWLQRLIDPDYNLDGWGLAVDADNNIFLSVNKDDNIVIAYLNGQNGAIIWQTGLTSSDAKSSFALELADDGHPVIAGPIVNSDDSMESKSSRGIASKCF